MLQYELLETKTIFEGYVFDVKVDKISYDGKDNHNREIVIHHGGAVILPVLKNKKILFVKQFRYPLQKYIIELPAGKLNKDEDPLICAIRELQEETGYTTNKITKLGSIYTSPGFCTEELHLFVAEDLIAGNHNREIGELDMELIELDFNEVKKIISNGELKDAKSISAITMFFIQRNLI